MRVKSESVVINHMQINRLVQYEYLSMKNSSKHFSETISSSIHENLKRGLF